MPVHISKEFVVPKEPPNSSFLSSLLLDIERSALKFHIKLVYPYNKKEIIIQIEYETRRGRGFHGKFVYDVLLASVTNPSIRRQIKHGEELVNVSSQKRSLSSMDESENIELVFAGLPELIGNDKFMLCFDISIYADQ